MFLAYKIPLTNSLLRLPCKLIIEHLGVTVRTVTFQNFKTREVIYFVIIVKTRGEINSLLLSV